MLNATEVRKDKRRMGKKMKKVNLSKSKFLAGLQCLKRLYLQCYQRELAGKPDEKLQAIFDQGKEVKGDVNSENNLKNQKFRNSGTNSGDTILNKGRIISNHTWHE